MQTLPCDILIVGAGIAGSALACALRGRGYRVVQVEMSDRPLDTARGDHLQCVVVEILDKWGALPAFWKAGAGKRHAARYVTERGDPILEVTYDSSAMPHPYYLYLHHELIADTFLSLAAEDSDYTLLRPARGRAFEVADGIIRSLTVQLDGQPLRIVPHLVVGADGRSSQVRQALDFTYETHTYDSPIVVQFAPREMPDNDPLNHFTSFMGPNGSISRIPRAFDQWKVGLTIGKEDIAFWKTATLQMRRDVVGAVAPELANLELKLGGFYPVTLLNTHQWVKGNAVLVGDACHAMHPARGQGMNVSIRCVDKLLGFLPSPDRISTRDAVIDGLAGYETASKPTIDTVLAQNHALGTERDNRDPAALAQSIAHLRAIQADPQRHRDYCFAAAGYGQ